MKIIGITGSSGSGKSTVAKIVATELNAKLIVADDIVKQMQQPGNKYLEEIIKLLGKEYLDENGILNRKKMAELIFKNDEKRIKINKLTQKYVVKEIKKQIKNSNQKCVVIDVPLLIESGLNKICNLVIGVIANYNTQIERICKRDNLTKENAIDRLKAQPDNNFYRLNAHYIVENDDEEYNKLVIKIRKILEEL